MSTSLPEPVMFLTNEQGTDLLVSFAVDRGRPGDVASVILLRTPKYEILLPEENRGVKVSHESHPDADEDFLLRLRMTRDRVEIQTTRRRYSLDVSRVDPAELREAREILKRMNFDGQFALDLA